MRELHLSKHDIRNFGAERLAENILLNTSLTHLDLRAYVVYTNIILYYIILYYIILYYIILYYIILYYIIFPCVTLSYVALFYLSVYSFISFAVLKQFIPKNYAFHVL